jgi:hypothetical protein
MNEHGMLAISYQGVLQIMFNHTVFNSEFHGYSQRASADELRAAIDVGRKQLSPNNKCHVIFIVFSKFYIKSAGGDGKFVVINKFRAF